MTGVQTTQDVHRPHTAAQCAAMTEEQRQHHSYGLHSEIPPCCVNFFVQGGRGHNNNDPWKVGYVRCPKCIARGLVTNIHICTTACVPYLRSIDRGDYADHLEKVATSVWGKSL